MTKRFVEIKLKKALHNVKLCKKVLCETELCDDNVNEKLLEIHNTLINILTRLNKE